MKYFRKTAGTHSRARTHIGILGGVLLVVLWIGIGASTLGGAATAAPELTYGRSPAQTFNPTIVADQPSDPTDFVTAAAEGMPPSPDTLPDFCLPDAYEPDDDYEQAKSLTMNGVAQIHGFHVVGDMDWYVINGLIVGRWYNATTSHLVNEADTYMVLRNENRDQLKTSDDVNPALCSPAQLQNCASSISWQATYSGPYYISVRTLGYPVGSPQRLCPGYDMTGRTLRYYLPLMVQDPTPTPVATPTATSTPTPSETPSRTPTPTRTATRTATATRTPTATRTATATRTNTPTRTPTYTPTVTPTPTQTPTMTNTPTITNTPTRTLTPTITNTPSPSATPTITRTPTQTFTPTATSTRRPDATTVPGLSHPNDVAVNPTTHRVYVSGRDDNRLTMIDGVSLAVLDSVSVGQQPWGVAINPTTNKVYVANFSSDSIHVVDATTLAVLRVIPVGPKPTFVRVNENTNQVFVVTYGNNSVVVLDGATDAILDIKSSGGFGAWGLAINPLLNRLYVSNRDSGNVTTLDGANGFEVLSSQTIAPCGPAGSSPYGLGFNRNNARLYIACSPALNVNSAAIYTAGSGGLSRRAFLAIDEGGEDGGGGVAVNTATGNVFFTNSLADTVSVIGVIGDYDFVIDTIPVGANPFGAGVDPGTGRVFIANRNSDDVSVFEDPSSP